MRGAARLRYRHLKTRLALHEARARRGDDDARHFRAFARWRAPATLSPAARP